MQSSARKTRLRFSGLGFIVHHTDEKAHCRSGPDTSAHFCILSAKYAHKLVEDGSRWLIDITCLRMDQSAVLNQPCAISGAAFFLSYAAGNHQS